MKPPAFEYVRPTSLDEALDELARGGEDAKALAGGQSLVPLLNMRLARPSLLVDLNRVEGLDGVSQENGAVRVGATVRQSRLPDLPLVREALPHVGHVATRNRGTVGGSIAHADPSGELAVCLAALGGTVVVEGPAGRRELAAEHFADGPFSTALGPGDLVVETLWPVWQAGCAFEELSLRHGDYALAMCAVVATAEGVRVALGSVVARPVVFETAADPDEAAAAAAAAADPVETMHATAAYRREATRVLVRRATAKALS